MKLRLCWVYHFLNVALPFTVASPWVGERACACISVCQCVQMWVCVCKSVCLVQSAWAVSMGLLCSWTWLYMLLCVWMAEGQMWVSGISRSRCQRPFGSVSDVRVVCRRSCRVMNKWSDREEERVKGERQRNTVRKRSDIIPFGKTTYFSKDVNNQQLQESLFCFVGALKEKTNFYRRRINRL